MNTPQLPRIDLSNPDNVLALLGFEPGTPEADQAMAAHAVIMDEAVSAQTLRKTAEKEARKAARAERRKAALNKFTDTVAHLYHTGNRKVRRALSQTFTMHTLEAIFQILVVILMYTAAFFAGFFIGLWLYSISVWLYAAFMVVLIWWTAKMVTRSIV